MENGPASTALANFGALSAVNNGTEVEFISTLLVLLVSTLLLARGCTNACTKRPRAPRQDPASPTVNGTDRPLEGDIVCVNVGGVQFCAHASTLAATSLPSDVRPSPESLLRRLADRDPSLPNDSVGRPFVDADPSLFSCILNFLRNPYSEDDNVPDFSSPPGSRRTKFCLALDFWGVPQLRRYMDPPIVRVILSSGKAWVTLPDRLRWLEYDGKYLKAVRWTVVAAAFLDRGYVLVFWTPGTTGTSFGTYPTYAIFAKS